MLESDGLFGNGSDLAEDGEGLVLSTEVAEYDSEVDRLLDGRGAELLLGVDDSAETLDRLVVVARRRVVPKYSIRLEKSAVVTSEWSRIFG
ncbi:MAG: hypothetical protein AAF368_17585, partial [Planctomycetota bacterium]